MERFIRDYLPLLVVAVAIVTMVISSILSLADHASKPAVHSASYAVLHSQPPYSPSVPTDQGRATLVSLSGSAPDHLIAEVVQ